MRSICVLILFLLTFFCESARSGTVSSQENHKGAFYLYWGYNRAWYSRSNIHFKGTNYGFTLKNVAAADRPSEFNLDTYFNFFKISIPQFNFRVGYFISDNYNISFGMDHMKYVMPQDQIVKISGDIKVEDSKYNGSYSDDEIALAKDFLQFEHTNGLNYLNIELRRLKEIAGWNKVAVHITGGVGAGAIVPKTDATLMSMERHDAFHLAGYGVNGTAGVKVEFFKSFFVQTEYKGGFINMPDIRTTSSVSDKASQSFFFTQFNFALGINVNLIHHKSTS